MLTILGPTATGKTALAAAVARRVGGEIISADSRQVFRRMTIGTGKDLSDYGRPDAPSDAADSFVPYHLIDICEPGTTYSVYQFQQDFAKAFQDIRSRGRVPILCGGTGLYIESILQGYYAEAQQSELFGISVPREVRRERISRRLRQRLEQGMVAEVQALLDEGVSAEQLLRYGLEYRFVTLHLLGQLTLEEMTLQLETAIHQFAKRQMTWFHGMEQRRGLKIHWIDGLLPLSRKVDVLIEELH